MNTGIDEVIQITQGKSSIVIENPDEWNALKRAVDRQIREIEKNAQ
jgi:hypothetical protein